MADGAPPATTPSTTEKTVDDAPTKDVIAESPAPGTAKDAVNEESSTEAPVADEKQASSEPASSDEKRPEAEDEKKDESALEEKANGEDATAASADATPATEDDKPAEDKSVADDAASTSATAATPARKKSLSKKKSVANLKKTPKKAAAVDDRTFAPGDLVLARLKGYPPWPSIILSEELLPDSLKKGPQPGKPKAAGDQPLPPSAWKTQFPIFFLGTYE